VGSIPVTNTVPPYSEANARMWAQKVSGFCQGAQSVKINDTLLSTRVGARVHLEGEYTKLSTDTLVEILSVAPRLSGYMTIYDTNGVAVQVFYTEDLKTIDLTGLSDGKYYFNSSYFAKLRKG